MAQSKRLILRKERSFLEVVDGTFGLLSTLTTNMTRAIMRVQHSHTIGRPRFW